MAIKPPRLKRIGKLARCQPISKTNAAERFNVSLNTILQLIAGGKLKGIPSATDLHKEQQPATKVADVSRIINHRDHGLNRILAGYNVGILELAITWQL